VSAGTRKRLSKLIPLASHAAISHLLEETEGETFGLFILRSIVPLSERFNWFSQTEPSHWPNGVPIAKRRSL